jgi:hypothetical protein
MFQDTDIDGHWTSCHRVVNHLDTGESNQMDVTSLTMGSIRTTSPGD